MGTQPGLLVVRRSIWIDASPERVWEEFETFEAHEAVVRYRSHPRGLRAPCRWLRSKPIRAAWRVEPLTFAGRVTVFDPPRELTFEQDWIGHGWAAPALITFRLTATLDGTLVELLHHGF